MVIAVCATATAARRQGMEEACLRAHGDEAVSAILDGRGNHLVARAAQSIGTTGTSGWASQLTATPLGEFLGSLAPLSAAARLIAGGMVMTLPPGATSIIAPTRAGAPAPVDAWAAEGAPIIVHSFTLGVAELVPRKFGLICAFSRELARRGGAESVIATLLREDAAATLDAAYFGAAAGDSATHAGMLAGVSPLAPSAIGGSAAEIMLADLAQLAAAVSAEGSGQTIFIASPDRAARMPFVVPGLEPSVVLPSLAVPTDRLIAVDPASWCHAFADDFDLGVAHEAVLHMAAPAAEIVAAGPTVADPARSLWQTDAIAVRLIADVAFAPRRNGAVAWIDGLDPQAW